MTPRLLIVLICCLLFLPGCVGRVGTVKKKQGPEETVGKTLIDLNTKRDRGEISRRRYLKKKEEIIEEAFRDD